MIRPLRNVAVLLFRGMAEQGDGMFTRTSESKVVGIEPIKAASSTRLPTHEVDPEASDRSVIGKDLRILGKGLKITGRGVLQIDGELDSDVEAMEVVVGEREAK